MQLGASYTVPGIYRQVQSTTSVPRVRTDVVGFIGFAGSTSSGTSNGSSGDGSSSGNPDALPVSVRFDDWNDYLEAFADANGTLEPSGSVLADAVQAFFRNGGSRCYVVNLGTAPTDRITALEQLGLMLGLQSLPLAQQNLEKLHEEFSNARSTTGIRSGLEALLVEDEVAVIALPDLFLTKAPPEEISLPIVLASRAKFQTCTGLGPINSATVRQAQPAPELLYSDSEILTAQQYLLWRCAEEAWRVFVLVTPPPGKNLAEVIEWRAALGTCAHAALYWPWLVQQDELGGSPPSIVSPLGAVAGVYARRDLARGPHVTPANEALVGIVDLERLVDDRTNSQATTAGINVLRSFTDGGGIQVWGGRTLTWGDTDEVDAEPLSPDDPFRWISGRRSLTAIERTAWYLGQHLVFEPNDAFLRAKIVHTMTGYLASVYQSGVLAGNSPDQAFFVRCDAGINPPAAIQQGQVVCDIGVALAVPAEFVVFRLSQQDAKLSVGEV